MPRGKSKSTYADFQACVKNPLEELEALEDALDSLEGYLREQKKPAARKRLIKSIRRANREREQAVKKIEFCNFAWIDDEAAGQRKCEAENKQPPTGAGGGGATGGNEGCEPGFLLCADHCCNTGQRLLPRLQRKDHLLPHRSGLLPRRLTSSEDLQPPIAG